ncbi:uncharacterized protein [Nicotiana tomentosiformis]|uniref:uncharacterized protein n=1 Tax=Nicotiana tomentosiformis TaxID=4098 RepID=UPI00388CC09F
MSAYTMHLISRLDPLKYIFQKPMPTRKLAKWKILLIKFDIVYLTQKDIKGQALADHLTENPVDRDYEPLTTYFFDEEILFTGEDIVEPYRGWRMFFHGAENFKGVGIGAVLISESGQHYLASAKIRFSCTNNMAGYEACIFGIKMTVNMNIKELLVIGDSNLLIHQVQGVWSTKEVKILPYLHCVKELCKKFMKIEFKRIPRIQNEFADAFVTLSSMIQHPDKNYIDPIEEIARETIIRLRLSDHHENIHWGNSVHVSIQPEVVIPMEVEIPSLRVIREAELDGAEWICVRQEQLMLIDKNRIDAVCHGQLYQNRMASAFNKREKPRQFTQGQLILKKIFPYKEETKGKFARNWQGPYMVHQMLPGGALILAEMDG